MANIAEIQAKFINTLSAIRRKNKITQKKIKLAQKVISRLENHEVDPRLSTVIIYLDSIGYNINNIFQEESIMKRPNKMMVDHLNLKLKEEGSCLRYIEKRKDCDITVYDLQVNDKYLDYSKFGMSLNISKEFEDMIRLFFKNYDVENIGFTNTVLTIFVAN